MADAAKRMLTYMLPLFELVSLRSLVPFPAPDWIADPWDRHLLAAALAGGADIVVLRDRSILSSARRSDGWGTVELLEPAAFLARFDPVIEEPAEPGEMTAHS